MEMLENMSDLQNAWGVNECDWLSYPLVSLHSPPSTIQDCL